LQAALGTLDNALPNRVLLLRGGYAWPAGGARDVKPAAARDAGGAIPSVVVELEATAARGPGWAEGGKLDATLLDPDGHLLASGQAALSSASRTCVIRFPDAELSPGEYYARVKARWWVMTTTDQVRIVIPEATAPKILGQPMLFRRGPYTGVGFQPTANLRFRKAERIRLDVPVAGEVDSMAGQVLDRRGLPLPMPVTPMRREDQEAAYVSAEIALSPLAQGDYVIEISATRGGKTDKVLTAIRIIP